VEQPYNQPNHDNQNLIREAGILDALVELMERMWPSEKSLKELFRQKPKPEKEEVTLIKRELARLTIGLIHDTCRGNQVNQEYVFFELVPTLQKYLGAGFPKKEDFEFFRYLVENCHSYADYKAPSKYKIIFTFIKKLFVSTSNLFCGIEREQP